VELLVKLRLLKPFQKPGLAESEETDKSPVSGKDEKAIPHISFIRVKYASILGEPLALF